MDPFEDDPTRCFACGMQGTKTTPVVVIVLYCTGKRIPVWLVPSENYLVCSNLSLRKPCPSTYSFIEIAIESSEYVEEARHWEYATILTCTPNFALHVSRALTHGVTQKEADA